ncbi:MAG: TIR domain-containing protein, partial [Acidimicrobiia bacterium]
MSTAEAGVRASESPVGVLYDGFLSYSHAADDLLAPRLQAGLQRFAKPWWKRRALRIFRDDASLSANPHLWSSITDALDESGWFVLLLSPDAAASEWVNREVEYWLSHKEASRIVPVVTEGEFTWADRDISPDTTAAPPALYGAFSEEPRWVDLRWARTDTDLDLRNTQFRAAVADIASAIRGVPKDELASEEVKQHRRTIRMAWAAGISVATLALPAVVAAVYAVGKGNEAEAQARISLSRELAASAISQLDRDSELSLLLALQAAEVSRAVDGRVLREAEEALHAALQRFRLELTLPETGRGEFTADGRSFVAADPISYGDYVGTGSTSGRHRFAREMDGEVVLWDGESGERIAGWPADARGVVDLALSPDGALLATTGDDGVKVWDMAARTEKYPPLSLLGPITPVFSPDGRYLAATSILGRVNVWDVATGDTVQSIPHPGLRPAVRAAIQGIAFSSDGSV